MSESNSLLQRLMQLTSTLSNTFDQLLEAAKAEAETSGAAKAGKRVNTGFSARGLDGGELSDLAELADRLKAKLQTPVSVRRNLQTEVFEEPQHVIVLITEPGLQMSNLVVSVDDDMLEFSADQDATTFVGEALLPCAVKSGTLSMLGRAGVIELRWGKQLPKKKNLRKSKANTVAGSGSIEQ